MPALQQPWKCIAVLKSQTAGVHCSWPAQESWLLRRHMAYTWARQGAQLNAQHIMAQPEVCNASWFIVDDCWLVGWLVLQRRLFADAGSVSSCYVHALVQYPLVGASTSQPRRCHFPAEEQDHGQGLALALELEGPAPGAQAAGAYKPSAIDEVLAQGAPHRWQPLPGILEAELVNIQLGSHPLLHWIGTRAAASASAPAPSSASASTTPLGTPSCVSLLPGLLCKTL